MTDSTKEVEVWNHNHVYVKTSEGESKQILSCRLTDDDINEDGTIEYPPSGECECYPSVEHTTITTEGYVNAVPEKELRELVEEWREEAEKHTLSTGAQSNEGATHLSCADELERVLENNE